MISVTARTMQADTFKYEEYITFPFGRVTPGHSGLVGSNSGMVSICGVSDWPLQGRCKRCGLTNTHNPDNGLKRLC